MITKTASQEVREARLGGLVFLKGVGVSDVAGVARSRHRGREGEAPASRVFP